MEELRKRVVTAHGVPAHLLSPGSRERLVERIRQIEASSVSRIIQGEQAQYWHKESEEYQTRVLGKFPADLEKEGFGWNTAILGEKITNAANFMGMPREELEQYVLSLVRSSRLGNPMKGAAKFLRTIGLKSFKAEMQVKTGWDNPDSDPAADFRETIKRIEDQEKQGQDEPPNPNSSLLNRERRLASLHPRRDLLPDQGFDSGPYWCGCPCCTRSRPPG